MSADSGSIRIIVPQSTLYGWNPLSFVPANEVIKSAVHSGQIWRHLMNAIAFSFKEQSKEYIEKMQNHCSVMKYDQFASYWISGGDFDGVLGLAIVNVPLFVCDDVRDRNTEDEATHQMMIDAYCRIPRLVHEHWQASRKTITD